MRTVLVAFAVVGFSFLAACSSAPRGEEPSAAQSTDQALTGGCRVICPNCHPDRPCPMIACYEDCSPPPPDCVQTMMCPPKYQT